MRCVLKGSFSSAAMNKYLAKQLARAQYPVGDGKKLSQLFYLLIRGITFAPMAKSKGVRLQRPPHAPL